MNEHRFFRLFRRIVLLSAPIPAATMALACGGAVTASTETETTTGAAGSGSPGSGGTAVGSGGSETGSGGSIGTGGAQGTGGGATGGGGNTTGAGGSTTPPDAGQDAGHCVGGSPAMACTGWQQVLARSCVDPSMAQVGAQLTPAMCAAFCGMLQSPLQMSCSVSALDAESVTIACHALCIGTGRRPEGLGGTSRAAGKISLGTYFSEMAYLEAASIDAFRILQGELAAYGAPRKLRRAAGRAAQDEVRHARMTGALARRFGGTVSPPVVEKPRGRSLEAIAIENAVEGCVRETYGALLATWQADNASDAGIRAAMKHIAKDETRHAALSWGVAAWLDRRLNRAERRRVAQARRAAVEELLGQLNAESDAELLRGAGLPRREQAAELAGHLARSLWS